MFRLTQTEEATQRKRRGVEVTVVQQSLGHELVQDEKLFGAEAFRRFEEL